LSGADLSQARNYMIDPGLNELKKAKFSLPEAMALLYNMDITLTGEKKED
jgi:fluoroquinolone resistance protein